MKFLAVWLLLVSSAFAQKIVTARAGLVYFADGPLQIDGQTFRSSARTRLPQLEDGQTVSSPQGHAEVWLGPDAVLWTDTQTTVRIDNTLVENAEVTVLQGSAIVELKDSLNGSVLKVRAGALQVELTREGLYRFDATTQTLRVYAGEVLLPGLLKVNRGEQTTNGVISAFDRKSFDEFHYWSAYRSFVSESEAGSYASWSSKGQPEREHPGFGVKFPSKSGSARVKYLAATEAGLIFNLQGGARLGTQTRPTTNRLPMLLGRDNHLRTENGRAEIFLGVGVVARLERNSVLRMLDTRPASPEVVLESGEALIEMADSHEGSGPRIRIGDSVTELLKPGLYQFDATTGLLVVYGGETSTVSASSTRRAKESQQVNLRTTTAPVKFDTKLRDPLFRWSADRSWTLFLGAAAFMTPWETTMLRGQFKHKQFGMRRR